MPKGLQYFELRRFGDLAPQATLRLPSRHPPEIRSDRLKKDSSAGVPCQLLPLLWWLHTCPECLGHTELSPRLIYDVYMLDKLLGFQTWQGDDEHGSRLQKVACLAIELRVRTQSN